MHRSPSHVRPEESTTDLHETARIPRSNQRCTRCFDSVELPLEYRIRGLGLEQVVNAGAPTALIRFVQWHEFDSGNRPEHGERRLRDSLGVLQVTRRVVCNRERNHTARPRPRRSEHLADITHSGRYFARPLAPFSVATEEVPVLLHHSAAAGGIGDYILRS